MPQGIFEWTWLALLIAITAVRKFHERQAGKRSTLRGVPTLEAAFMVLWGIAAGVLPLLYLFSPWLDFADYPLEIPAALQIIGVGIFVAAIWLLHRSHADLGKWWSPSVEIKAGHALVVDGVYRRVRHPMYAAHLLWGIAQSLLLPNFLAGVLALILILAIMALRIPREERAMIEAFGDEYLRYMNRTGRMIPALFSGFR